MLQASSADAEDTGGWEWSWEAVPGTGLLSDERAFIKRASAALLASSERVSVVEDDVSSMPWGAVSKEGAAGSSGCMGTRSSSSGIGPYSTGKGTFTTSGS